MNTHIPVLPKFEHSGIFERRTNVQFHSHTGIELILLLKGTCSIKVDSLLLHGKPGTLFIIPENTRHNQINSGEVHTIYATFLYKYFDKTPRTLQTGKDGLIKTWMQQIHSLNHQPENNNSEIISGILYAIISHIQLMEKIEVKRKSYPAGLCKVLDFIEQNPDKTVSLNELAERANISSSYLISLFNLHVGLSPMAYSMNIKMKMAEQLLQNPYLSIKQVAMQSGFRDTNYFCRLFRKFYGHSAGEHRRVKKYC